MTDIVVDVFPPNVDGALSVDPADRLVRLTDQELKAGTRFKYVKLGTGDATIVIPADIPEAETLVDDALLQWWDLDLSSTVPLGVSTLEKGGMTVIGSRSDDRVITWNGLGGLALFARAMLLEQWYALGPPVQVARGSENRDGIWWWINQPFGAILRRTYEEGRDQPGTPLAGIIASFTRELDSAGVAWTIIEQEFQRQWGTNGIELLETFMRAGVIPLLRGNLTLDAYETYGTDRSGAAFGAGVLRFTDENIVGRLEKAIAAHERVKYLFVRGADNVTAVVTDPTAPVGRYGVYDYPESNDPAILTKVGNNAITSKRLLADSARFQIYDGNDPTAGRYRLGPPGSGGHGWVGDTLTLNSGEGQHHYVEEDMPLAAVEYRLLGADGWGTFVEAGTVYLDAQAREINELVRSIAKSTTPRQHTHPESLCPSTDLFRGLAEGSLKTNGDETGWPRTNAVDGDDAGDEWSGTPLAIGVTDMWFGLDIGSIQLADAFRLRTATGSSDSPQNIATEARLYGTNDADVWGALVHGSGKLTTDPPDNGWVHVATHTSPLTDPSDSGHVGFTPAAFRYWLWKAISGGTSEWDINTLELWSSVGDSTRLSRCGHHHGAHEIAYGYPGSTATTVGERLDELAELAVTGQTTSYERLLHGALIRSAHRDSDESPYLLVSDDGIAWSSLTDEPLFDFGASARDPSILHYDGSYWVAHTGTSSEGEFTVWRSPTLVGGWVQVIQVDVSAIAGVHRVWAPEWFVDDDGSVHIFFAASTGGVLTNFQIYEVHPINRGMTAWSAPELLTGTALPDNMIDPFMVRKDGFYYLWVKNEDSPANIELLRSSELTTGYELIESGDWTGWRTSLGAGVEGVSLVKIDDDRWRAWMVQNAGFGTVAVHYSDSIDDWETWSAPSPIDTPFLTSHGTTIRIPGMIDHLRDHETPSAAGDHGAHTGLGDDDHPQYLTEARHDALAHDGIPGILLTVDAGSPTYDDAGDDVVVDYASNWGYDADGPYFDAAGATAGEEAILAIDPTTGELAVIPYNP